MTGIDDTVLAEALRLLSPYRDQGRVWDTLEELIAAPPAQREAILRQPRQQEPSTSESTKGRFFNGHNKKSPDQGSTNFAWWPEDDRRYPSQQFEKMLTAQFLWYATHTLSPAQGDRGNAATWTARAPEDAWDVVESVCRKYRVPRQTVSALHAKGGPREWVGEMIRQAKLASANHAVAQKTLAKQQGSQPGAAPSRWDSAYRQPPGAEDDPPYGDLDRPAALLEGRRLDRPHPAFLPWQPPENWDLVGPYSGSLVFADGTFLDLPYLELFGGEAPGEAEFVEGENLLCRLVDTDAHLEQQVTALSYPAALAEEEAAARALGYTHHPPKLWLDHLDYLEDTQAPGKAHLTLYLGSSDYLGHRVYRREMARNPAAQAAFQETLAGLRGDAEHRLRQCPWASCGGGVWPVVRDGNGSPYVILSLRNPRKVAEVAGRLGYGASGSYDRSDGTPAQAMAREIQEELGLPAPKPEALTLLSLGVDTERYLLQFSYLWETDYTLSQVSRCRRNRAPTAGEQTIFFVPLAPPVCEAFLRQAAFEPGAAYSLMRLLQKRRG